MQSLPTSTQLTTQQPSPYPKQEYLVGAFWYPWFGLERHWGEGYLGTPLLGEYDSADEAVLNRQIEWAAGHGIDFWAASWWGRDTYEDKVIRAFTQAEMAKEMRFAILYESTGLLNMQSGVFDMNDSHNRQKLSSDMKYLAEAFFDQPNYLLVDGRPVVLFYLTRIYRGEVETAFDEARRIVREATSIDLYIIGDEVYWHTPVEARLKLFDAVTAYNMHTSVAGIADGFAGKVDAQYRSWASAASAAGIAFVPDVLPGFDDTAVRPEAGHPVIPRSPELFTAQLKTALELASGPERMILITSWNEWHEYTSIEPAQEYGNEYLELLKDALENP